MAFNPKEHMMPFKGKEYLQVMWRLVWFREEHPDWGIDTVMVEHDEEHAVFTAKITDETGRLVCSGHGSESKRDFGDFTEKAETKAVGRALAMLGYGTQFAADELDEGDRIVDSPVARKDKTKYSKNEAPQEEAQQEELDPIYCENCMKPIMGGKIRGKIYSANDIAEKSLEKYKRFLCYSCMKEEAAKTAERVARQYESREDGVE